MADPGDRFRFIQITDTHIMEGGVYTPARTWPGQSFELDTTATVERVVEAIASLPDAPVFVVITGDLASPDLIDRGRELDGSAYLPSYSRLRALLEPLRCPVRMLLGNHDHRGAFHEAMGTGYAPDARYHYSFDHGGYHFVALDSHVPRTHGGALGTDQLAWLAEDLKANARRPTVVFVHHPPWPIGHSAMDDLGLEDGDELMALLERNPQVSWLLCGHVHMDHHVQRGRLTMLTSPATCFQVDKTSEAIHALPGPPAYRIVDVAGESLSTRVIQLS